MTHRLAWGVIIIGIFTTLFSNVFIGIALLLIGAFMFKRSRRRK